MSQLQELPYSCTVSMPQQHPPEPHHMPAPQTYITLHIGICMLAERNAYRLLQLVPCHWRCLLGKYSASMHAERGCCKQHLQLLCSCAKNYSIPSVQRKALPTCSHC